MITVMMPSVSSASTAAVAMLIAVHNSTALPVLAGSWQSLVLAVPSREAGLLQLLWGSR
jgi:hypothetical protein